MCLGVIDYDGNQRMRLRFFSTGMYLFVEDNNLFLIDKDYPEVHITPNNINATSCAYLAFDVLTDKNKGVWEEACVFLLNAQFIGFIHINQKLIVKIGKLDVRYHFFHTY